MPLLETKGAASAQGFGLTLGTAERVFIEDVFSTFLYPGNSSTQTITNGIDLSGKGGLVWIKRRDTTSNHFLTNTTNTPGDGLRSNTTGALETGRGFTSFNSNGFSLSADSVINGAAGSTYASWTFRKQPKFFDVVTYTGNGANRTISHNLGSVPGCIIVKRTDATSNWSVYHQSRGNTKYLILNSTFFETIDSSYWNATDPTASVFSLGTNSAVNASGGTYVAYLFAHDAGGFGLSGTDNVISCGSYFGNGSATGPTVTLGYEPQWLMIKAANDSSQWNVFDNMRGLTVAGQNDARLMADDTLAESNVDWLEPTATGFQITTTNTQLNNNEYTYIYIAIRRGPMRVPTSGTQVYNAIARTGTGAAATVTGVGFAPDWLISSASPAGYDHSVYDRLRGPALNLWTNLTNAETTGGGLTSFDMSGITVGISGNINESSINYINHFFRRAPGFFDVVCYTGTGSATTVSHNLGVAPELLIVKSRTSGTSYWPVYSISLGNQGALALNETGTNKGPSGSFWNSTSPTATTFALGSFTQGNANTESFVAYLFASCPGVSKIGSYTGTGNTLQINCGFTGGARFVLIKRTDSTGDWYVWDTARGIVAGNDPYLLLNSTAAEVTTTDWVDTFSSGFELSNVGGNNVNINTATYIYLAIA